MISKSLPNVKCVIDPLNSAQSNRQVLQDFTPLSDSLEWTLGSRYFACRGSNAFLSERIPVPYVINNTGALSRRAADGLFAALCASGNETSKGNFFVLELGIGLGLFARYFLDAFRDL